MENYVFHNVIGTGRYGTVYRATHVSTKLDYAIKKIPYDKKRSVYIEREIFNQQKFDDYHICKLYENFIDNNNTTYLVQELLGSTLYAMDTTHKIGTRDKRVIIGQILSAIRTMHDANVYFGDLKHENICFKKYFHWSLIDFGLSQTCDQPNTGLTERRGTLPYLAPEVFVGNYGYCADIWALGIIVYRLFYDKHPFSDVRTPASIKKDIMTKDIDWNSERKISDNCRDFIALCLRRDVYQRPSAYRLMQHDFIQEL